MEAGLTALRTVGVAPGLTNMLAKYAADRLDHVHDIRIRMWSDFDSREPLSTWSSEYTMRDLSTTPTALIDGKIENVPWYGGEERYEFPGISGEVSCVYVSHPEPYYLSRAIGKGLRNADIKRAHNKELEFRKRLMDWGLLSRQPIDVKGVSVSPLDVLVRLAPQTLFIEDCKKKMEDGTIMNDESIIVADVRGEMGSKEVRHVLWCHVTFREANKRIPGATSISYLTATPPAIAAVMLGKGEIKTKGMITPEMLAKEEIATFMAEMAKRDIIVHERMERVV
jgi:saccharopine dehydrogenase-like NADP-dependent oxidoreductase